MPRYALLADIHGNLDALEAVLSDLDNRQVSAKCFLGDIVVYGPEPSACLARLREALGDWVTSHMSTVIAGNNDYDVGLDISPEDVVEDIAEMARRRGLSESEEKEWKARIDATRLSHEWTRNKLGPEERDVLRALNTGPQWIRDEEFDILLVHASPCEPIGTEGNYLRGTQDAEEAFLCFEEPICLFAHTHHAGVFRAAAEEQIGGRLYDNCEYLPFRGFPDGKPRALGIDERRLLVNPGSVGQPRDRDNRASYAILDSDEAVIEFYRVQYDVDSALRKLEESDLEAKFTEVLANRLKEGA